MESLRKIIRSVLRESVIEETQAGQKDLEKFTNDILKLVAEQIMKEKAHLVWLTGNDKEQITKIPLANTLMMNGDGFSEIEDFVMSTNIRIAPTPTAIRGKKSIKGELEYGPPNQFNEEYYKIWLKYSKEDLDEINEIFNKEGREVTTTDIYFKLFYMFYSILLHELQHAYDAWRSKGKAFGGQLKKSYTSSQEKADMLMKTKSGYDEMTPEEIEAINNSRIAYLNLVHEINARYAQAMHKIVLTGMDFETFDDIKEDWNKVYRSFKTNFDGWRHLSDKMKKKLTRRLAKAYQEAIENLKTASEKYSKENLEMVSEDSAPKKLDYRIEHMGAHHGQEDLELGLYIDDEIVGMVQYTLYDGELTVRDIIVRPEFRRQGYGSKMMKYIKQQYPEHTYVPSMMTDLGAKFVHKNIELDEVRKIVRDVIKEGREVEGINDKTKLSIFDFDKTLVNTPEPEFGATEWEQKTGQKWKGSWWENPNSLDTKIFDMSVNPSVISAYKKDRSNSNNLVIMMTGRKKVVEKEVMNILSMKGLKFDDHIFNDGGETLDFKIREIKNALRYNPNIREVEMWDDRTAHIPSFQKMGDELVQKGYLDSFKVNHVK